MKKLSVTDKFQYVWKSFHRLRKYFDSQAPYAIIDHELTLLNKRIKELGEHIENKEFMKNLVKLLKEEEKQEKKESENDNEKR